MKYLLVVLLVFAATGDSLWAYYHEGPKVPPPPPDQCRMVRKNRHRPKVCVGNCAVCVEKTCAAQGCGKAKR